MRITSIAAAVCCMLVPIAQGLPSLGGVQLQRRDPNRLVFAHFMVGSLLTYPIQLIKI